MTIQVEHLPEGGFDPNRVKMWIYGDSGAGKTWFSATWEDNIIIAVDPGIASITWPINVIRIHDWFELFEAYMFVKGGDHPYKTIVLDSLNEAQKMAMLSTLENFPQIKRSYDSLPSESDWGKMLFDFDKMVRKFVALPYNIVVTSLSNQKTFSSDSVTPLLDGKKTISKLIPLFDVVGYIYKIEDKKRVIAFDIPEYVTKDRSNCLPAKMEGCTHSALKKLWLERKPSVPDLISYVPEIQWERDVEELSIEGDLNE